MGTVFNFLENHLWVSWVCLLIWLVLICMLFKMWITLFKSIKSLHVLRNQTIDKVGLLAYTDKNTKLTLTKYILGAILIFFFWFFSLLALNPFIWFLIFCFNFLIMWLIGDLISLRFGLISLSPNRLLYRLIKRKKK